MKSLTEKIENGSGQADYLTTNLTDDRNLGEALVKELLKSGAPVSEATTWGTRWASSQMKSDLEHDPGDLD